MRDRRINALKGALISVVVLGHFLEVSGGGVWTEAWLNGIYLFHMPAFVFISGLLSKGHLNGDSRKAMVIRLLIPLAIFHVLYAFALRQLPSPATPTWLMWFLWSLLLWRLMLPFLIRVRGIFLLSAAAAVVIGYVDFVGYRFGLARTVYFLPFFLAGHLYGRNVMAWTGTNRWAVSGLAVTGLAAWAAFHGASHDLLFGSKPFNANTHLLGNPAIERGAVLIMSGVATAGFFALSCTNSWLEKLGAASMSIYLLHGFIVKAAELPFARLHPQPWIALPLCMCAAGASLFVCAALDGTLSHVLQKIGGQLTAKKITL